MKPAAIGALILGILFAPVIAVAVIAGTIIPAQNLASTCSIAVLSGTWRPPLVARYVITSNYGLRYHPVLHQLKLHTGIDLVSLSDKTVVAAADGVVTTRGNNIAYGNQVVIDHAGGIRTRYAHMSSFASIRVGQTIGAGTKLGIQGSTGYVTGPHLHFEIIRDGRTTDPQPFMAKQGAPLNGVAIPATPGGGTIAAKTTVTALPAAGTPRRSSLSTPPASIPPDIKSLYVVAGRKYGIPWNLLAGIGMEETAHGRNKNTSSAGAKGLMQFMPATWKTMGVDGNGDGRIEILNPSDSIHSAANYLTKLGVKKGGDAVRKALFSYNHADWYVNDVLFYAQSYQADTLSASCPTTEDTSPPAQAQATMMPLAEGI